MDPLAEKLLDGEYGALAKTLTRIENHTSGHRRLVSELYGHTKGAHVVGITGSPGAGKSTLVDAMATVYRERDQKVGIIAIDPSSPYTGGAILGDRIRMTANATDMDVFFRSMSTRGSLGGLSTATTDAITAMDAFGMDVIVVETVGAGQNEIDVVRTADSVVVLVTPGSGDDVQMLKAGILEIADCFVINKADRDGTRRMRGQISEMLRHDSPVDGSSDEDETNWERPIVETIANEGDGVEEAVSSIEDHYAYLEASGELAEGIRTRHETTIRWLLRDEISTLVETRMDRRTDLQREIDRIVDQQTDPYSVAEKLFRPVRDAEI